VLLTAGLAPLFSLALSGQVTSPSQKCSGCDVIRDLVRGPHQSGARAGPLLLDLQNLGCITSFFSNTKQTWPELKDGSLWGRRRCWLEPSSSETSASALPLSPRAPRGQQSGPKSLRATWLRVALPPNLLPHHSSSFLLPLIFFFFA
jgi:hypothetical protein